MARFRAVLEKHREIIRQMFAPVTQALVDDGLIGLGDTVLDIATGLGEPALTMAALVGSESEAFGIDPAPEMVTRLGERQTILGSGMHNSKSPLPTVLPIPSMPWSAASG
jgi:hypothetical protein